MNFHKSTLDFGFGPKSTLDFGSKSRFGFSGQIKSGDGGRHGEGGSILYKINNITG